MSFIFILLFFRLFLLHVDVSVPVPVAGEKMLPKQSDGVIPFADPSFSFLCECEWCFITHFLAECHKNSNLHFKHIFFALLYSFTFQIRLMRLRRYVFARSNRRRSGGVERLASLQCDWRPLGRVQDGYWFAGYAKLYLTRGSGHNNSGYPCLGQRNRGKVSYSERFGWQNAQCHEAHYVFLLRQISEIVSLKDKNITSCVVSVWNCYF